jgi:peptidoglycan/LPS O-acetylase OafA/YrhL
MVRSDVAPKPLTHPTEEPRALRYDSLTFWRGVACLVVIVLHSTHYWPASRGGLVFRILDQGWIGVPIFFVISGYCITASADALRRCSTPVKRFFWRRARRILPPYWVWFGLMILSVYLVESFISPDYFQIAVIPPLRDVTKWRWLGNITLTEMWRTHITGEPPTVLLWCPAWTLCYEEQFYAVMGLILLFARQFLFRAVALISLVVLAGPFLISGYDQKTYGIFLNYVWLSFAAGVLAYYILNYVEARYRDWYCIPLIAGTIFLLTDPRQGIFLDGKWVLGWCGMVSYLLWKHSSHRWRYLSSVPLVIGIGCAFTVRNSLFRSHEAESNEHCVVAFLFTFLIIALKPWDEFINRSKALAPIRFCGEMCYSLYLVHWPVVVIIAHTFNLWGITNPVGILFITVPCCAAVAIMVARIFHLLVERRFWNPRIQIEAKAN